MGLWEDVGEHLKELLERAPGDISGAAVLRPDGLMIASALPKEADEKKGGSSWSRQKNGQKY